MDDIDVRGYIINNFKNDSKDDVDKAIRASIESGDDDPLVGLGVLFEIMWNNSSDDTRDVILSNIVKGLTN